MEQVQGESFSRWPDKTGGSESPILWCVDADRYEEYLVKFQLNRKQGVGALINEVIAYQLALKLDVPVPPVKLVYVDESIMQKDERLRKFLDDSADPDGSGLQYGCLVLDGDDVGKRGWVNIDNLQQIPNTIVYDNWLLNTDRKNRHIWITGDEESGYEFRAIDHGHILNGPNWQGEKLQQHINTESSSNQYWEKVCQHLGSIAEFDSALHSMDAIGDDQLEDCFSHIPHEWGLHDSEKEAVKAFLVERKVQVKKTMLRFQKYVT